MDQNYAQAVDDILSWLDGEQSHSLIKSFRIRVAAVDALDEIEAAL